LTRFDFAFAPAYRRLAWPLGVNPDTAWVEVRDDEVFEARFGFWRARLAITDRGLTFATNGKRGVLILFETPVRGLDPLGILRHPS
jgi:hypothetical protein